MKYLSVLNLLPIVGIVIGSVTTYAVLTINKNLKLLKIKEKESYRKVLKIEIGLMIGTLIVILVGTVKFMLVIDQLWEIIKELIKQTN